MAESKADLPSLSVSKGLALQIIIASTSFVELSSTAQCKGVFPCFLSLIFGSPPRFSNRMAIFVCCFNDAICRTVSPSFVQIFGLAPLSNSSLVILPAPISAALCRGVSPNLFYKFGSAPLLSKLFAASKCLQITERYKGDQPIFASIQLTKLGFLCRIWPIALTSPRRQALSRFILLYSLNKLL